MSDSESEISIEAIREALKRFEHATEASAFQMAVLGKALKVRLGTGEERRTAVETVHPRMSGESAWTTTATTALDGANVLEALVGSESEIAPLESIELR